MKMRVTRYYFDKVLRTEKVAGEELDVDESRAQVLVRAGVAEYVYPPTKSEPKEVPEVTMDAELDPDEDVPVAPVQPKKRPSRKSSK